MDRNPTVCSEHVFDAGGLPSFHPAHLSSPTGLEIQRSFEVSSSTVFFCHEDISEGDPCYRAVGGGPDCRHFVLMRMLDVYRQVNDSNDSLTRRLSAGGAANPGLLVHFDGLPLMSGNDTAYRDVASAPLAPLLRPAVICSCMDIIKLPGGRNDGVVVDAYAFAKQSDSPPPLRVIAGLAQLAAADGMLTHRGPMVGPHLTAL